VKTVKQSFHTFWLKVVQNNWFVSFSMFLSVTQNEVVFGKALIPTHYTSFDWIITRHDTRIRRKGSGVSGAGSVSHDHQVSLHSHTECAAPSSLNVGWPTWRFLSLRVKTLKWSTRILFSDEGCVLSDWLFRKLQPQMSSVHTQQMAGGEKNEEFRYITANTLVEGLQEITARHLV